MSALLPNEFLLVAKDYEQVSVVVRERERERVKLLTFDLRSQLQKKTALSKP